MAFLNKYKNNIFLIVLLIALPAFFALLKPGYWNMHDDMQMIRQLELEKCIFDGQIPCRWTPDLGYGYGYPLFNFYPPMPYIVGQIFRTLGFSFIWSVKLTAILQIYLCALFMYLLALKISNKRGAILASLFYTYVPYHAVNIYVRGAMNEAWSAVFFPLIFLFSLNLIKKTNLLNFILLSLSLTGLLLSHNPMALTFAPILIIWCLYWLYHQKSFYKIKQYIILGLSGLFSLLLSAFYTLPVLFETKLVQIETMFENYYHYSVHFTSLYQLFISNFWGDGPSVWGQADKMSFMIGYLHWLIPLAIFIFIIVKIIQNKKIQSSHLLPLLIISMGFFTAFMTHERSTFLWKIFSPIQKIQFPWRFLNHTSFLLPLSLAFLPLILKEVIKQKKYRFYIFITLAVLLFSLNISYFKPVTSGPITDAQKFSGLAWTNQITSGIYDYLPKTASTAAKAPAKEYIDLVEPQDTVYTLSGQKRGTDWMFFNLNLDRRAIVTLSQLYFPEFEILNHGQKIDYQIEPELGRISLNLDRGDHQIYLKFRNTPIRTVSNFISFLSWSLIFIFFTKPLWQKLISKK